MGKIQKLILLVIIGLAFVLRFYNLGEIPPGMHADEASQGFNAFSILKTGKDMYGKSFPILFRAGGSYQPPVNTYLMIIPTLIWGNSVFTVKFTSAVAGLGLVILTFLIASRFGGKNKKEGILLGLIASGILAISPWAIHFSRIAVEANIGVFIFVLGIYFLLASLKKNSLFPLATLAFGISTHTYYSERVITVILLAIFIFLNRKVFLKAKKTLVWGLGVFGLILLPHLFLLASGALTKRMSEVSYLGNIDQSAGILTKVFEFVKQFINHYLINYSPKNLFFDPGSSLGRAGSDLAVFYPWMVVFFIIGIGYLFKNRNATLVKLILILLIIATIPSGLTGNDYYPLRTLDYLWAVSMVVAFGCFELWKAVKGRSIKVATIIGLLGVSLFTFWISYLVIFKYEVANVAGKPYMDLMPVLAKYSDREIRVDFSGRSWGVGMRATYLAAVDPKTVQANLIPQMKTPYYSPVVNAQEVFKVGNISFEPLDWSRVCGKNLIVVGDELTFDPKVIGQHQMKLLFTIPDYLNKPILFGYSTTKLCN